MNIDEIKEIMDNFDPASLLPDLTTIEGKLEFIAKAAVLVGPIILLILGLLYLFASPKEANHYFGYRCYFGMGSVNAWRFTQRLAGIIWGGLGLILSLVMLLITGGFAGLAVMDLIWKAVVCLFWEVGLVAVACLAINTIAMIRFNRKGEYRGRKA